MDCNEAETLIQAHLDRENDPLGGLRSEFKGIRGIRKISKRARVNGDKPVSR